MTTSNPPTKPNSSLLQLVVNFVIPTIILLRFSAESQLGPAKAMLLALAFPVAMELYGLAKRRKPSMLSIVAIIGIMVTGAISLLGLSENWLAVRRSVPYIAISVALLVSLLVKRSLVTWGLEKVIDMQRVVAMARKKGTEPALQKCVNTVSYLLIVLFAVIGISSYILTLVVITASTNTASFNTEYVRLRVVSLPATTLPLLLGVMGILIYLLARIEKLTGLNAEALVRKKQTS